MRWNKSGDATSKAAQEDFALARVIARYLQQELFMNNLSVQLKKCNIQHEYCERIIFFQSIYW